MKIRRSRFAQWRGWITPTHAIAFGILLICLAIGIWLLSQTQFNLSNPNEAMQSIHRLGWRGIGLYIGLVALAIIVSPIPSAPFTVAAGALWGPFNAAIYGSLGLFLGSMVAYFIGRTLGRTVVKALTGRVFYLSKHRGEHYLGWLMFISHLVPILPCDLMSYSAGISGLSLPIYTFTTLLGIVPGTLLLTFLGAAFTISKSLAIALIVVTSSLFVLLSRLGKHHRWFDVKDVIRFE